MVETITPVVHGGRNRSYRIAIALHAVGATAAAGAVGLVLGLVGMLVGAPWGRAGLLALAGIAFLYALRDAFHLPVPLFDRRRQVPEWWRTFYSKETAAILYGIGLGAGFFTYLSYGTFVAVSAAALLTGDPIAGALLCAPFGLARGLSVIVGRNDDAVERLERGVQGPSVRLTNAATLALLGLASLAAVA